MTSKIHLICRDQLGLKCIDNKANLHSSEAWRLSAGEAEALIGGIVHFHQTKASPSYFGGVIQSVDPISPTPNDDEKGRYVLTLRATKEAKGVPWDKNGRSHGMAWSSGVI